MRSCRCWLKNGRPPCLFSDARRCVLARSAPVIRAGRPRVVENVAAGSMGKSTGLEHQTVLLPVGARGEHGRYSGSSVGRWLSKGELGFHARAQAQRAALIAASRPCRHVFVH